MSPTPPRIAVLLAAYNGMQWIEEQLATIQAQTGVNVHIFISVDASSDGTEAWCDSYARTRGNVTLLPPDEPCRGAARNFFHLIRDADLQDFDFVALSDQDDIWHEDKLQRATSFLSMHPIAGYSTNITAFWPDGKTALLDKAQPQVKWDYYFEAAGPGCTYVLKREFSDFLQRRIRSQWAMLEEITLHDWYIYAIARGNGYSWHIDSAPSMDYRQHGSNQFGANVGIGALLSRYKKICNGWWFGQVQSIERLVNQTNQASQPSWHNLNRIDLLGLSVKAGKCRRRRRDKIALSFLCLTAALFGTRTIFSSLKKNQKNTNA